MTRVVLDDLLLKKVVANTSPPALLRLLDDNEWATTNLYQFRLCRSAVAAARGQRTGRWPSPASDAALRAFLAVLPADRILPMTNLVYRMAELMRDHPISTLGAEAVAAAESFAGVLCVAPPDDGPNIRRCCDVIGVGYRVIPL